MQRAVANCVGIEDQFHESGNPLNQDMGNSLDHLRSGDTVLLRVELEFVLLLLCLEHILPCVCHLLLHRVLELMVVIICVVSMTFFFGFLLVRRLP